MNRRRPTRTIVISSIVAGMLPVILAALTGTGTTGAYVFLFLIAPILLVFLMWPERTRFFVGDSATSRRTRPKRGQTRRRSRPRAL